VGGLTHPTPPGLGLSSLPRYRVLCTVHTSTLPALPPIHPLLPGWSVADNLVRSRNRLPHLFLRRHRGSTSRVLSVTPPPPGRDKARSNRPVVISHPIGGTGSGHGSELVGCSSCPLHHNLGAACKVIWSYRHRQRVGAARHATVRRCDVAARGQNKRRLALPWPAETSTLAFRSAGGNPLDELDDECVFSAASGSKPENC
jgi:hypothetical protein